MATESSKDRRARLTIEQLSRQYREARERADRLEVQVEKLHSAIAGWNARREVPDDIDLLIDESITTALVQRDADTARDIHLALSNGAELNNLHKAPTAGHAVDFLLSLARQEVEKREPLRLQAEGGKA